ncbi:MAG: ABC transporter ATP-binding protein [Gammaproteobacteria bacterium]|nr:ABC transporter ATP-binding protein [Gammaproteobacteria bacterium]MBT8110759.1 ABC transporter ATP-binding protein [Gammaproteobacteria bacterium]NND46634.1 ABC transporter ATP-binding protein [Woeseiaceae bacterium]NNL45458.1 ABC transporter ATP-binding protein [Woeseiaceae bacterium]
MHDIGTSQFSCNSVRVGVAGRLLVDALELNVMGGELIAVLGQNGSGKSLTMHTLAGLRPTDSGRVLLNGRDLATTRRQEISKWLALLPQHVDDIFPATVLDTAMIGRHPHIGRLSWESDHDYAVANEALAAVGLAGLSARDVLTLSGGERRRLAIAQVLTQQPHIYLLDEPTNHLDPQHQIDALQLFRDKADTGNVVIASLHDVNLAVRYADRCLLLYGDGRWDLGASSEILNPERLSALYSTPMEAIDWRSRQLFIASGDVST